MVCSFARQALTMMATDLERAGVCSRLVAESYFWRNCHSCHQSENMQWRTQKAKTHLAFLYSWDWIFLEDCIKLWWDWAPKCHRRALKSCLSHASVTPEIFQISLDKFWGRTDVDSCLIHQELPTQFVCAYWFGEKTLPNIAATEGHECGQRVLPVCTGSGNGRRLQQIGSKIILWKIGQFCLQKENMKESAKLLPPQHDLFVRTVTDSRHSPTCDRTSLRRMDKRVPASCLAHAFKFLQETWSSRNNRTIWNQWHQSNL